MTSPARIAANRRNAQKSTGPRTPEGKRAVRLNALWHGAFATDPLLPDEDPVAFSRLRDGLRRHYQPASQDEEALVQRAVLAAWRLQRLAAMETRVLVGHGSTREQEHEPPPEVSGPSDPIAAAWIASGNALDNLARYQTMLERSFYRAAHRLERIRAMRCLPPHAPDPPR